MQWRSDGNVKYGYDDAQSKGNLGVDSGCVHVDIGVVVHVGVHVHVHIGAVHVHVHVGPIHVHVDVAAHSDVGAHLIAHVAVHAGVHVDVHADAAHAHVHVHAVGVGARCGGHLVLHSCGLHVDRRGRSVIDDDGLAAVQVRCGLARRP